MTSTVPRAAIAKASLVGRLARKTNVRLAIVLPLRNKADLDQFLARLYDPKSLDYGHYLTPKQFDERYGPTEAQYQAVEKFAKSRGLSVTYTWPDRLVLDVAGPASTVESAFGVRLNQFRQKSGRVFYAPDRDPSTDKTAMLPT